MSKYTNIAQQAAEATIENLYDTIHWLINDDLEDLEGDAYNAIHSAIMFQAITKMLAMANDNVDRGI